MYTWSNVIKGGLNTMYEDKGPYWLVDRSGYPVDTHYTYRLYSGLTQNIYTATMNELINQGAKTMPQGEIATQTFQDFDKGVRAAVKYSPAFSDFNALLMDHDLNYSDAYKRGDVDSVVFEDAISEAIRTCKDDEYFYVSSKPNEHKVMRHTRIAGSLFAERVVFILKFTPRYEFTLFLYGSDDTNGWKISAMS